jgi:hypothetical protein
VSTDPGQGSGAPDSFGPVTDAVFAATAAYTADLAALEDQAAAVAAGPLRNGVAELLRRLTALYARLAGSLDAPLPVSAVPQLQQETAAALNALRALDPTQAIADSASQAYHRAAAFGQEQVGAVAVDQLPGAQADGALIQALDDIAGTFSSRIDEAQQIAQTVATLDYQSAVLDTAAKAGQAAGRAEAAARWSVNRGGNAGMRDVARQRGSFLLWVGEPTACLACVAYVGHFVVPGQSFPIGLTWGDKPLTPWPDPDVLDGPPLHANCLPGDALVTSRSRITGATSRVYNGELVEIRTLANKVFTATPNHPVLTDRGWVALGCLDKGSHVVGTLGSEGVVLRDQNDHHVPTRIKQVAEAFLGSGHVVSREVPVAAEDFHGDGTGSEVAVVGTNRLLRRGLDPSLRKHPAEMVLERAGVRLPSFSRPRAAEQFTLSPLSSADCSMGRFRQTSTLESGSLSHAYVHGFTTPSGFDSLFQQEAMDCPSADSADFGQCLLAGSSGVELDQVISVRRYPFSGHVYNLETEAGWYISNGIVTHNCRCELITWLGPAALHPVDTAIYHRPELQGNVDLAAAMRREAKRAVLRGWSLPSESEAVRLRGAERLLRAGSGLPKTVEARARKAVKDRHFPDRRHVNI